MTVCRWSLDCPAQATRTVEHFSLGSVETCDGHAEEHDRWAASIALNRGAEPEPECWCTDADRDNGIALDYCPAHGTPELRGIDPLAEEL